MAVTTKKLFPATSNATTTVFSPVGIQLNNQDDLDVYVTLSGGTRVLQLRQSQTGTSTATSSHPQVNNTDGLYFPAVSVGTTLYNYTLSSDNNTITFNSALPQGAVVFCERRTRDADSSYTSFASGSTIRATDLNNSSTESNFTAQDGRNKALTIEGVLFRGDQPSTNFVTSDHIVAGTIVTQDIANDAVNADKIADDVVNSEHYAAQSIDTEHIALENITTSLLAPDAVTSAKLADNAVNSEHYVDASIDHVHLANDIIDGDNIQDDVINSEHYVAGSIDHEHLANDIIDGDNIQDSVINSEHYVDGSIDREHLATDIVDGTKIADDSIDSEHIAAGALDNEHYAAGSITSDKLNAATVITAAEQGSATANDTSFLTSAAADARFFNVSTGDTIKDGQTFPDNDTTIATTAAINDRIIDLVDDVGGFVPIANETSFPTSNPDVNNGAGTIVSVSAASTNLAPSGTTVTIANGRGSGLPVVITGVSATIPSGFGFLVETTTTAHTYTFHRLSPKATEVTTVASNATQVGTVHTNITQVQTVHNNITDIVAVANDATDIGAVAGKATEIGRLGTADAVADMAILGTTDVVADMAILGTTDVVADMNTLGTADVVADMNMLATADIVSDMNALATSDNITAMDTCRDNIASINNASSNISSVNNFGDTYQIASSNPSTDGGGNALAAGDLYFNTSANELKVYNGSAWQGGVTASGNFASITGNTFTGSNTYNDNVKAQFGTNADGLEIFHDSNDSIINDNGTGSLKLQNGGSTKLHLTSTGAVVTGNIGVTGNVDGRDVAADGTKLDGIEANAINASNTAITNKLPLAGGTMTGNISIQKVDPQFVLRDTDDTTNSRFLLSGSQLYIQSGASGQGTSTSAGYINLTGYNNTSAAQIRLKATTIVGDGNLTMSGTGHINIPDSTGASNNRLRLGSSSDLQIYHDSSHSWIRDLATGNIYLDTNGDRVSIISDGSESTGSMAKFHKDGAVQLFYDGSRRFQTQAEGVEVYGAEGGNAVVYLFADEGDDNTDKIRLLAGDGTGFYLQNKGTGSWVTNLKAAHDGNIELYHQGNKMFETTSTGVKISNGNRVLNIKQGTNSNYINLAAENTSGGDAYMDINSYGLAIKTDGDNRLQIANDGTVTISQNLDADGGLDVTGATTFSAVPTVGGVSLVRTSDTIANATNAVNVTGTIASAVTATTQSQGDNSTKVATTAYVDALTVATDLSISRPATTVVIYSSTGNDVVISGASTTQAGVMIASDKSKLDGIATGANVGITDLVSDTSPQLGGDLDTNSHHILLDSSHAVKFGDSANLQIQHNGSSFGQIYNDTGHFIIDTTGNFYVRDSSGSNVSILATPSGATELYNANNKKFETASYGVKTTGEIEIASGHLRGDSTNGLRMFSDSTASTGITLTTDDDLVPGTNNAQDLGTSSLRWANVYTNDLNLSNEGSSNDVDGTWGDWTIQEGESDLFLKNNRSGKKYKFNLTEVS